MDCITQARKDEGATKKRIKESERRIDTSLDPFIQKKYWCAPRCITIRTHQLFCPEDLT